MALLAVVPAVAPAQMPSLPIPGGTALPMGGLSKDTLLKQAKELLAELTSMKSQSTLAPEQMKQVDELLPKATSLTGELEKPQLDVARLPQLASSLGDLQKQVGMLKGLVR
jgi:hypothetical protein